jgi:hypothetical protein
MPQPMATVLRFEHDVPMSGQWRPRPTNYALSRIFPPPRDALQNGFTIRFLLEPERTGRHLEL